MFAMRQVLGVGARGMLWSNALRPQGAYCPWGGKRLRGTNRTERGTDGNWEERHRALSSLTGASSDLHTPGAATPLFRSDCWMIVKNYFFLKNVIIAL